MDDEPKSNKQIVDEANELARAFYQSQGYGVPDGYRFETTTNPRAKAMWNLAAIAYEHIEGTDINEVLAEYEENENE